jgi:hypothetical protein
VVVFMDVVLNEVGADGEGGAYFCEVGVEGGEAVTYAGRLWWLRGFAKHDGDARKMMIRQVAMQ